MLNNDVTKSVNVEVGVITGLAGAVLGMGVAGLAGLAMAASPSPKVHDGVVDDEEERKAKMEGGSAEDGQVYS